VADSSILNWTSFGPSDVTLAFRLDLPASECCSGNISTNGGGCISGSTMAPVSPILWEPAMVDAVARRGSLEVAQLLH
jgi:hypothetical protein